MRFVMLCAVSVCLLMTACFANDGYLPDGSPDFGNLRWGNEVPDGYVAIPHGGFVKYEDMFRGDRPVKQASTSVADRTETVRQVVITKQRDPIPRPRRERHTRATLRQTNLAAKLCDCGCGRRHCHCSRRST